MKKNYISPAATVVDIEATNMLATSLKVDGSDSNSVDTSIPGGQLSSGNRRPWGNLWK